MHVRIHRINLCSVTLSCINSSDKSLFERLVLLCVCYSIMHNIRPQAVPCLLTSYGCACLSAPCMQPNTVLTILCSSPMSVNAFYICACKDTPKRPLFAGLPCHLCRFPKIIHPNTTQTVLLELTATLLLTCIQADTKGTLTRLFLASVHFFCYNACK